ncbi:catalase [Arthrobacter sp. UM1]|uniref:catalase n=1 Tax=Arthrobacter sp. UM1 TaxID=2766776 RepID=UPI001CF6B1CF|nr:catalase [Arthrobacter sp. UM1]MCB4208355.1 catalase [Arthrobacter sp. UM1]
MTESKFPSTTEFGAPAGSDRNSLSVGPNGLIPLHDVHLVESLAHFNRMNVPERRPHAKGSGAFGTFEVTNDVSKYTKASLFQPGSKVDMLARFSTVAGELGSPDTWRDVRGFSLKFYTDEGNYDMVGNNTPVFFVRDPMKFPHFIRSQKRLPDSGLRDADMQWDFWTQNPETAHQVTYLMGSRGIPKTWRHMHGFSSHTYMWINEAGERYWVKYHFLTNQGIENLSADEAERLAGADAEYHRRDLFEAIERGDFPSWTLKVQIMPFEDAKTYRFNPFDLTKTWSQKDYPLIEVGTMTLNKNPKNHFSQIEQAAFAPSNLVPGIGISPDKMLLGRVFAYADAHRYRIGTNFAQLPVNRPIVPVNTYNSEGNMTFEDSGDAPVYAPNSLGRPYSDETGVVDNSWESDGEIVRSSYELHAEDDDFGQPGTLYREVFSDAEREEFLETLTGQLSSIKRDHIRENAIEYWTNVDADLGAKLRANLK